MSENHTRAVRTRVSIVYLKLKSDGTQSNKLTQKLVFLAGVEFKKITPAWEDWFNSFIFREYIKCKYNSILFALHVLI